MGSAAAGREAAAVREEAGWAAEVKAAAAKAVEEGSAVVGSEAAEQAAAVRAAAAGMAAEAKGSGPRRCYRRASIPPRLAGRCRRCSTGARHRMLMQSECERYWT